MRDIFNTDTASKYAQAITRDNYRGYIPLGFFTPNGSAKMRINMKALSCIMKHRLTIIIASCDLYAPNRWPEHTPHAKGIILDYWHHLDRLTATLIAA